MKKKIISCLLAMSLIASSGSYAFAVTRLEGNGATGDTKLTKSVQGKFLVTVPETIEIPASNNVNGTVFDISAGESKLATNEFLKVNLVDTGSDNFNQEGSYVKLVNGENEIFSPLRLTKAANGGSIVGTDTHANDNEKLFKIKNDNGMVACFGPGATGNAVNKSLTEEGYRLYAYRAYMSDALDDVAGDAIDKQELIPGTYQGIVTFQLEVVEKEPEINIGTTWQEEYDAM